VEKERLDRVLVERGLVSSRTRARALIMEGVVLVDDQRMDKPGTLVSTEATIRLTQLSQPYVSRGGLKLQGALDFFGVSPEGKVAMDIGASTGGFTDCLLQRGAVRVYAVDVGYGQLAWKLQVDPRVRNLQRHNIRHLLWNDVGEKVDLAVVDTSFISLKLVIPATLPFVKPGGELLTLVKPQFEVGRGQVGKGGVVRDAETHREVIEKLIVFAGDVGCTYRGAMESPLRGPRGNKEFFLYLKGPRGESSDT